MNCNWAPKKLETLQVEHSKQRQKKQRNWCITKKKGLLLADKDSYMNLSFVYQTYYVAWGRFHGDKIKAAAKLCIVFYFFFTHSVENLRAKICICCQIGLKKACLHLSGFILRLLSLFRGFNIRSNSIPDWRQDCSLFKCPRHCLWSKQSPLLGSSLLLPSDCVCLS